MKKDGDRRGRPYQRCSGCRARRSSTEDTVFAGADWNQQAILRTLLLLGCYSRGSTRAWSQFYTSSIVGERVHLKQIKRIFEYTSERLAGKEIEYQRERVWDPKKPLQADCCFRNRTWTDRCGLYHCDLDQDFKGQGCIFGVLDGFAPDWGLTMAVIGTENWEEIFEVFSQHMPCKGTFTLTTDGAKAYEALVSRWNSQGGSLIEHWVVKHQTAAARRKGVHAQYSDKKGHTSNGIECQWHRLSQFPRLHPVLETDMMARAWLLRNRGEDFPVFLRIVQLVCRVEFTPAEVAQFGKAYV
jgi:hypothetical protein